MSDELPPTPPIPPTPTPISDEPLTEVERRRRGALVGMGVLVGIPIGIVAGLVSGLLAMAFLSGAGMRVEAQTRVGMLAVVGVLGVVGVVAMVRVRTLAPSFLKGLVIGTSVGLLLSTACWGVLSVMS